MQKCMIQVFCKLTKLPVAIMQHNFLFLCITIMTAWLQQLNLFPTTHIGQKLTFSHKDSIL